MIELGDIVRLKRPFAGYTHGIVAEVVSTFDKIVSRGQIVGEQFTVISHTKDEEKAMPRIVSLFLFKPTDHEHDGLKKGTAVLHMATPQVPKFVDFNVAELILVKKAKAAGYHEENIDIAEVLGLCRCPECGKNLENESPIDHLMKDHGWDEEKAALWWIANA